MITIPQGARIVVRMRQRAHTTPPSSWLTQHISTQTSQTSHNSIQTATYYDVIGHVIDWDGHILHLMRDAAANGSRPEEEIWIEASHIVRLKPVPERRDTTDA